MKSFSEVIVTGGRCRRLGTRQDSPGRRGAPRARAARMALFALLSGIAIALTSPQGLAQQPVATPTPAPRNPDWCSDVPASPAPPHFENVPGEWAAERKMCMNAVGFDSTCMYACQAARELWQRAKTGGAQWAAYFPAFDRQAPDPSLCREAPRGIYCPYRRHRRLPRRQPAPKVPQSPQHRIHLGSPPTGSFSGADLSATADAEPPDVAADTSAVQTVEFVNGGASISTNGGLYVFD